MVLSFGQGSRSPECSWSHACSSFFPGYPKAAASPLNSAQLLVSMKSFPAESSAPILRPVGFACIPDSNGNAAPMARGRHRSSVTALISGHILHYNGPGNGANPNRKEVKRHGQEDSQEESCKEEGQQEDRSQVDRQRAG